MNRPLSACVAVQPHLEAFADGELRGDALRRVAQHVEGCEHCSASVDGIQGLGESLRGVVPGDPTTLQDGSNIVGAPLTISPYGINGGFYYARVTFNF